MTKIMLKQEKLSITKCWGEQGGEQKTWLICPEKEKKGKSGGGLEPNRPLVRD